MNDRELIDRLQEIIKGLRWLNESDYPFNIVYWENVKDIKSKLLEIVENNPNSKIEERELDRFFASVIKEEDWYEEEERKECQKYRDLLAVLQANLTEIKVYRVSEIEVHCYILGKTSSGAIAGISTISVET